MSLRVLSPGTYSLLVDGGRPSTRGLGVSVGGPADAASLILGNALVGNPAFTPAVEITLSGPTLIADCDVGICIFGAPFQIDRDGESIASCQTFTLKREQTLRIGGTGSRCRAYLCVPGGFHAKPVLQSVTAFEPLKEGDRLMCEESILPGRSFDPGEFRSATSPKIVRVLPGPQADWFDESFFGYTYRVTPASNRMGIRLDGPALQLPKRELVSEPVAPGAIQITNDGKPIVLGVDGQTIGGYPKVAHVISADLDELGQMRPGNEVRFHKVGEHVAQRAFVDRRNKLGHARRRIAAGLT